MKEVLSRQTVVSRKRKNSSKRRVLGSILIALSSVVIFTTIVLFSQPTPPSSSMPSLSSSKALGSGLVAFSRDHDLEHVVQQGESLSEIADFYGLDAKSLAEYNDIKNPEILPIGMALLVPSQKHEKTLDLAAAIRPISFKQNLESEAELRIRADRQYDGLSVTAHFSVDQPSGQKFSDYEWNLGNGKRAFRPTTNWSYEEPGTYGVNLRVRKMDGTSTTSNTLYIDVPHPGSYQGSDQQFVTLNSMQESFRVNGTVVAVANYGSVPDSPLSKVGEDGNAEIYQANTPGFYALTVDHNGSLSTLYVFASPVPSVHSDRNDMNWYRTQFNTGTLSNCGPSSVSMAYAWAKGGYLPVASVRQAVGWKGNGSTSFDELYRVLAGNNVSTHMSSINRAQDLFRIIDRGDIAITLINTGGITRSKNQSDLFGRYYSDVVGHYVVVKGYSQDHQWVIVYDPIPSDWAGNNFRQADGISMSGRNRYYSVEDFMSSLRSSEAMEIRR